MSKTLSAARMGTEPLNPLLLSLAIPMMISMLVQALYNVVDSIFVSYVNEAALSAVSLAFPIQNLLIAFAVGTAVGVNAYLSKNLGEGNHAEADRAAANGLFLAVCSAVAFLIFGLFGAGAFIRAQTTDPLIARYGVEYLSICTIFSLGCCVQCMMEKILVSTGRSTFAMTTQLIGALTNIVLDPIFIFGLFGVPRLEAAGAAVATVIGQCLSAAFGTFLVLGGHTLVKVSPDIFRLQKRLSGNILSCGFAFWVAQMAMGFISLVYNSQLGRYGGDIAISVYAVISSIMTFVIMPASGISQGIQPILGNNYGCGNYKRVMQTFCQATVLSLVLVLQEQRRMYAKRPA